MRVLKLSWHALVRDWRAGELRVLALALMIAVASVTTVGFFTDRVQSVMLYQANELLAADLAVDTPEAPDSAWIEQAKTLGLRTARTLSFASVALSEEDTLLSSVKAVSPPYPLRGNLRTAPDSYAADEPARGLPAPGAVWVEPRLLTELGIAVGDRISLGASAFRIARVLTLEPDRGGDLIRLAPRILMNLADVEATGLVLPGSRVRHRLLVAGDQAALKAYRTWLETRLGEGQKLRDVRNARPELRTALDRAERFFGLAALVTVLLASVAIAMAARHFTERHTDGSAVLRCLGATRRYTLQLHLLELAWLGLPVSLAGAGLGYIAQHGLVALLAEQLPADLPPPSLLPVLQGLATGLLILTGFALAPLLRLGRVPPARVLRRDLEAPTVPNRLLYGLAAAAMALLMVWQSRDLELTLYVFSGTLGTLALLVTASWLAIKGLSGLRSRVGVAWRFGLANIARRPGASVAQVSALGVALMAILLLSLVREDLLSGWLRSLPPDAPNHFLINVPPDDVPAIRRFLSEEGLTNPVLYPMVRGRLIAVNGRPIAPSDYETPRAQRLLAREFNLTWAKDRRADNRIVAGRWWQPEPTGRGQLSVEVGLAQLLGLKLGDRLRFRIAGRETEGEIASLRSVEWDSFRPNFFVIAAPGLWDQDPATYITSFFLPQDRREMLTRLVRAFPSTTVLDVDALMKQVRSLLAQVARAVAFLFLFSLLAGLVVIFAAIRNAQDERRLEGAILRTLGARRGQLLQGLAAEFFTLGALAGAVAALAATAVSYAVTVHLMEVDFHWNPWVWVIGVMGGALGVGVMGTLGVRSALDSPPLQTLRAL